MSSSPAGRPGRRHAALARIGLDPTRATNEMVRAGLLEAADQDPGVAVGDLLEVIRTAADPEDALRSYCELAVQQPQLAAQVRADNGWLERYVALAGTSRPLADLIARHDAATRVLVRDEPVAATSIAAEVADLLKGHHADRDELAAAVTAVRRRCTASIAARDLTGSIDVVQVAAELSALAEGVLHGTLTAIQDQVAAGAPSARIAVIGMGKLGGNELNYISDVDVLFVHEPLAGNEQAAADEARVVCEELLAVLNASTTMGRAYEIDPTLRPEGRMGALSRTISSFVGYWERWAKTWEFQALLKARPVAGDAQLGAAFMSAAEPFVYPDHLDPAVVAEVRRMKGRVESKPEVRRHGHRQVKLGPGGLRDIEFAVQLLQLVHGRADQSLRETGTVAALAALAHGGYVGESDAEAFTNAYRHLRSIEHRLQLAAERRTHTIPDDHDRQERLARSLGYRSEGDAAARDGFLSDLRSAQAVVRELHEKLFYRPLLEAHAAVSVEDSGLAHGRGLGDDAAMERLTALGFTDARSALRDIRALTSGVSREARTMQVVLPAVLNVMSDAPDPDTGMLRFRDLVEARDGNQGFLGGLRDSPVVVAGLAQTLATSDVAADLLMAEPGAIEWFDASVRQQDSPVRDVVVEQAMLRLRWQDATAALRRYKRNLLLRTVLRDVLDDTPVGTVGNELTVVAEALVEAGLRDILTQVALERGGSRPDDLPMRMAVIGMGKFGGSELHYVSDLDLMFVHEPLAGVDRSEVHELANDVAERLIATLGAVTAEGTAFEMDADLRPEGKSGPLSRSLESFDAYYQRWSEPWEHQALTKARAVAGDVDLGERFIELARPLAFPADFDRDTARAMRRMKARLEKERIKRRQDPKRHLKLGPGGLSDVEWTVQMLQQRLGSQHPVLRTTNTMAVIDALQDLSLVEHRDAAWLREGYRFLGRVRNRLYLLRQRDVDVLPSSPVLLARLAHGLGYGPTGRQDFEDEYLRHTRHIRRVSERLFFDSEA